MAGEDDDAPRKKKKHELGEDLATLSLEELSDRIALLKEEIARIEAAIAAKKRSAEAAATFFKR
jgi:uncharacterized small protein (DUF1192 family)